MCEHSKGSPLDTLRTSGGVDDYSNVQQTQKLKINKWGQISHSEYALSYTWKTEKKMSREFVVIRADAAGVCVLQRKSPDLCSGVNTSLPASVCGTWLLHLSPDNLLQIPAVLCMCERKIAGKLQSQFFGFYLQVISENNFRSSDQLLLAVPR